MATTTIHVRKRDTWEYYFTYQGKRYSKAGIPSKGIAKKEGEAKLSELLAGIAPKPKPKPAAVKKASQKKEPSKPKEKAFTLRNAFDEFYEVSGPSYKFATLNKMKKFDEPILEPLMNKPLAQLDYKTIQLFFNSLSERGSESNRLTLKGLSRVFECAIKCKRIVVNPTDGVKPGGVKQDKELVPMTNEDLVNLIKALDDPKRQGSDFRRKSYKMAVLTGYYLGLRIGEVMALTRDDFDLVNKKVTINKTLIYIDLKKDELFVQDSPKTDDSNAVLDIPDPFIPILKEWFQENPHNIFICDEKGKYIHPDCMSNILRRIARVDCGFKFHFHLLRHLVATNLYDKNADAELARGVLRHKDIKTTINVYTHISQQKKSEKINEIYSELPQFS